MSYLPIAIDLDRGAVLILGDGPDVLTKIKRMSPYEPQIKVITENPSAELLATGVEVIDAPFREEFLFGAIILYDFTEQNNEHIWNVARGHGVLVNVHDQPADCDFVTPAIFRKDHMSVAVSSNAREVRKSIAWRNKIRDWFTAEEEKA